MEFTLYMNKEKTSPIPTRFNVAMYLATRSELPFVARFDSYQPVKLSL
jgi:hypothetical protein